MLTQFVKGKTTAPIIVGWNTIESLIKEKKFVVFLAKTLFILLDTDNNVLKEEERKKSNNYNFLRLIKSFFAITNSLSSPFAGE